MNETPASKGGCPACNAAATHTLPIVYGYMTATQAEWLLPNAVWGGPPPQGSHANVVCTQCGLRWYEPQFSPQDDSPPTICHFCDAPLSPVDVFRFEVRADDFVEAHFHPTHDLPRLESVEFALGPYPTCERCEAELKAFKSEHVLERSQAKKDAQFLFNMIKLIIGVIALLMLLALVLPIVQGFLPW